MTSLRVALARRAGRGRWVKLVATLVAGAVAAVTITSTVHAQKPTVHAQKPTVTRPAAVISLAVGSPARLRAVASQIGVRPNLASGYFDDRSWPGIVDDKWAIDKWKGSRYRMIWAVPMLPTTGGYTLASGANGAYDGYFHELAVNLVAAGMADSILRLGWEFNVTTYPWYAAGQSAYFVGFWQQIVNTMRAVPGAHFSFEWNPSRGDNGQLDKVMGSAAAYYPGDGYVQIVGLDVYDVGWDRYPGAAREFKDILTQPWGLDWLASFAAEHGKPMAIPEMGLGWGASSKNSGAVTAKGPTCGGDDPTFINDMADWIAGHNVVNAVFWNYGKFSVGRRHDPRTFAALKADF